MGTTTLPLSSAFFTAMVNTPLFMLAVTFLGSAGLGSHTVLANDKLLVNGRSEEI